MDIHVLKNVLKEEIWLMLYVEVCRVFNTVVSTVVHLAHHICNH